VDYSKLGKFDLIFTSPPYFDREIYSIEDTQSCMRYPKYQDWRDKFLFKVLDKCVTVLLKGGHLIINIKDINNHNITYEMCEHLTKKLTRLPDIKFIQYKLPYKNTINNKEELFYCFKY
jgi:DNA modification methylase